MLAWPKRLSCSSYYEACRGGAGGVALGRPVLANARCDVLLGQCPAKHAGLYYEDARDFAATLDRLLDDEGLAGALGRNGREYFARHYSWPVIERKYLEMFDRLASERAPRRMEELPGWFARRRPTVPAAVDVLADLPRPVAIRASSEVPA